MAYIDSDAILTAIRDVIQDGTGNSRAIASARFDGGFYNTLARDEQSRRALVSTRAEARISNVSISKHNPSQPSNTYLYDLRIVVDVVRHLNNAHRLVDATRDDVKALAVSVISHRLIISAGARMRGADAPSVVSGIVESVPVPGAQARGWVRG